MPDAGFLALLAYAIAMTVIAGALADRLIRLALDSQPKRHRDAKGRYDEERA